MRTLIVFAIAILLSACGGNKKNCKNAACTEMFAMVDVKLTDSANTTLSGISTQTILLSSGQTIHTQSEAASYPHNSFTVADDSDIQKIGYNATQIVELRIIKDTKVIKTVQFNISTDCCHISKKEGPAEVSLN